MNNFILNNRLSLTVWTHENPKDKLTYNLHVTANSKEQLLRNIGKLIEELGETHNILNETYRLFKDYQVEAIRINLKTHTIETVDVKKISENLSETETELYLNLADRYNFELDEDFEFPNFKVEIPELASIITEVICNSINFKILDEEDYTLLEE